MEALRHAASRRGLSAPTRSATRWAPRPSTAAGPRRREPRASCGSGEQPDGGPAEASAAVRRPSTAAPARSGASAVGLARRARAIRRGCRRGGLERGLSAGGDDDVGGEQHSRRDGRRVEQGDVGGASRSRGGAAQPRAAPREQLRSVAPGPAPVTSTSAAAPVWRCPEARPAAVRGAASRSPPRSRGRHRPAFAAPPATAIAAAGDRRDRSSATPAGTGPPSWKTATGGRAATFGDLSKR